jgi:hypothetical protein
MRALPQSMAQHLGTRKCLPIGPRKLHYPYKRDRCVEWKASRTETLGTLQYVAISRIRVGHLSVHAF